MIFPLKFIAFIGSVLCLHGCATYQAENHTSFFDQGKTITAPHTYAIEYELKDEYFRQAPECVTILPMADNAGSTPLAQAPLEAAFARHLHARINRVIGPREREILSRQLAFDLRDVSDRKAWQANRHCHHFMTLKPLDDAGNYLFFWSRKAVGVEAQLTTENLREILWSGRHIATRHSGSLPITPFAAVVAIYKANSFAFDEDITHSLADDLARRILGTLPALRDLVNSY